MSKIKEPIDYYNLPVRYDSLSGWVVSEKTAIPICVIRGWGSLIGNPNHLSEEEAFDIQNKVGEFVAQAINEKHLKDK